MATVLMLLSNVVESSTLPKLRFSHMRGQDLEEFRRDGYFIDHTDYYVHCARPDDPSDVLYDFPAIPCFEVWSHDLATPPYWNEDGGSSLSTDHYTLRTIDRTPHELAKWSDRAVTERDENCVMSDRPVWITKRAFLIPWDPQTSRYISTMEDINQSLSLTTFDDPILDMCHPKNGIALKPSLLKAYNNGEFVFLSLDTHWRAHFFDPTSELGKTFDQKAIRLSSEIPRAYLRVRVTIAAFKLVKDFVEQEGISNKTPAPKARTLIDKPERRKK
jgi:hypothetical protein